MSKLIVLIENMIMDSLHKGLENKRRSQAPMATPVILATWENEIWRIKAEG
jgi:hypothetical protein